MDEYTLDNATDQQLYSIINEDKMCPNELLSLVCTEMMKRNMFENLIYHSARTIYKNVDLVLKTILFMDREELYQIGHIEIYQSAERFKQGSRTFKTFIITTLKTRFIKLIRDANAQMRQIDFNKDYIDNLELKTQDKFFQSHINIERTIVNKLFIQERLSKLREVERQAIDLDLQGYTQYEISEQLGFKKTYANILLNRAYKKMKVYQYD